MRTSSVILKKAEAEASANYLMLIKDLGLGNAQIRTTNTKAQNDPHYGGGSPDPNRVCCDGERTGHLVRLAGMWVGQGKSLSDVIASCSRWNATNTPPLDNEKIESTCKNIEAKHRRNHPNPAVAPLHDTTTPLFDLASASVGRMLRTAPPPRTWVVDKMLPQNIVGMIVAPGGMGKSMFALQLGLAVASGKNFMDTLSISAPGGVLMLFAEDDINEIHRRLDAAVQPMSIDDSKVAIQIEKNLLIKSMISMSNLMTDCEQYGPVRSTGYADRLILAAKQIADLRLIVIDPASRFRGGDENSAQDATRFVEELERIRAATGAVVLVLHHANKASASNDEQRQGASRGSSAMTDGVRWQMNLSLPTIEESKELGINKDQRKMYLVASVTKNNYGPPTDTIHMVRGDGGVLSRYTFVGTTVDPVQAFVDMVWSEASAGRYFSMTSFCDAVCGENGQLKIGKVKARKLIERAITEGKLYKALGKGKFLTVSRTYVPTTLIPDAPTPSAKKPSSVKKRAKSKT